MEEWGTDCLSFRLFPAGGARCLPHGSQPKTRPLGWWLVQQPVQADLGDHKRGQQQVTVLACAKPGTCQEWLASPWSPNRTAKWRRPELLKDALAREAALLRQKQLSSVRISSIKGQGSETFKTSKKYCVRVKINKLEL